MAQTQKAPRLLHTHTAPHADIQRLARLAPGFDVELDTLLANRMVGFGLPGSGKTNLVALLAEQIGQYSIPEVIFDWEGDFLSLIDVLPRGVIATPAHCPSGTDILQYGLQVIFDLASWGTSEAAATVITTIVRQLMAYTDSLSPQDRVPCPVFLDEAHKWLPEKRGTFLCEDTYKELQDAFCDLGSRGRKRGLTSALFAQRISLLAKSVLFPGIYFLLQQTMHTDLARYLEYIQTGDLTAKQVKARIAAFPRGKAIVKLPDAQRMVTFDQRASEHTSHTPTSQVAITKYTDMPLPARPFGSYHDVETAAKKARKGRVMASLPAAHAKTPEHLQTEILRHLERVGPLTLNKLHTSYMKDTSEEALRTALHALVDTSAITARKTSHSTIYTRA